MVLNYILVGCPWKILLFSKKSAYLVPWVPESFFYHDMARHNRSIFAANNRKKPSGTQGTYLASWISQVQNTDYYEPPSITFLENSLDKSWNLENIMNLYVGWREGLGMNGSKKRNKWKFVSTRLVYDICSDRFGSGKSITIALPGWGFMLDWALYIILPRSKA